MCALVKRPAQHQEFRPADASDRLASAIGSLANTDRRAAMQRSQGSRGGYSRQAVLETDFLQRQLGNAELIKRLKVLPLALACVTRRQLTGAAREGGD